MKYRVVIVLLLMAMWLVGCGVGGPSNAEAKEVIFGVYFRDASILGKHHCELTPEMEDDGQTDVWLIRYKFKDSDTQGVMLIGKGNSEEYPWISYMSMAGMSKEGLEGRCP